MCEIQLVRDVARERPKYVRGGTGPVLAAVLGIVTSHGGSVDVESRPGCLARCSIRVPVDKPDRTTESV